MSTNSIRFAFLSLIRTSPFWSLLLLVQCVQNSKDPSIPLVQGGEIIRLANYASEYVAPRHVDVWLPPGYNPAERYAVVYMQDGQMLFDADKTWNGQEWGVDETLILLKDKGEIPNTIIVGIWNTVEGRHADYFPQKPFEALSLSVQDSIMQAQKIGMSGLLFEGEIRSDMYLKFLVEELKPYIDTHFSVYTDRAHTFIMGSSMGGLISLYAIAEYPDVFGGAAGMSTHWLGIFETERNPVPGVILNYLNEHIPDPNHHLLYFDCGTVSLDSFYKKYQLRADSILLAGGYNDRSFRSLIFEGATHSEMSWKARLAKPITFLLGNIE